jgi:monothiol glutaredoxin
MSADILDTIKDQIETNPILLYMKGSPAAPQCGFSAQAVRCLISCGQRFAYVDILAHPEIRAALWVEGELVGGSDIITEMLESGELKTIIDRAAATAGNDD